MKKITITFLLSFFVVLVFSQGKRLIVKQDGMRLSYDLQMLNVVEGVCTKDLRSSPGDRYLITVYLANETGKKLTYTGGYVPIVSFQAIENGCFPNIEHINVKIPLNPGDVEQASGYFIIHSGTQEASIRVSSYTLRGYKIPEGPQPPKYYWAEGSHTSFNNRAISEIFTLNCEKEPNQDYLQTQFMNYYENTHYATRDVINKIVIMGPFYDYNHAKNIRQETIYYAESMCKQNKWKFNIEANFKPVCK